VNGLIIEEGQEEFNEDFTAENKGDRGQAFAQSFPLRMKLPASPFRLRRTGRRTRRPTAWLRMTHQLDKIIVNHYDSFRFERRKEGRSGLSLG